MTRTLLVASFALLTGCAHTEPTGEEHRAAAAKELSEAAREKAKFQPGSTVVALEPRGVFAADPIGPRVYNPSASHLAEADRKMEKAFAHLEAARKLDQYKDAACSGLSTAERTSCPLIAPHLERIEEGSRGVVLHLKTAEKAKVLAGQMRCHLAFAQANNFEQLTCPLYMKGVAINLSGERAIEVLSMDANVAQQVRGEARKMFGEGPAGVSAR